MRFLWLENVNSDAKPDTYQVLVHIFGGKDSPSCANYAARRTPSDHGRKFDAEVADCANRSFYMDDLLKSVETEKQAVSIIKQLIEFTQIGRFDLTKFQRNKKEVIDCLPAQNVSQSTVTFNKYGGNIRRTLWIHWNITDDNFFSSSKIIDAPPTKRGVLSPVSTIFGPIGLLAPFVLKAKLLLQSMWRLKIGWDDKLPPLQAEYWEKWLKTLFNINQFHVPRFYNNLHKDVVAYEVHIFSDASELAYGVVAYLKLLFTDGTSILSFLMGKLRLAPVKTVSLPRQGLNAAVVGVRIAQFIKKEISLPLNTFKYWTDSTLTLQYITDKSHRFKVHVANRVAELVVYTDTGDWQHIDGKMNPADMCTRGLIDPVNLLQQDKNGKSWKDLALIF